MILAADQNVWKIFEASIWPWLGLVASLGVAVWLAFRIRAWYRDHEDPAEPVHEMLTQFGDLHRRGALSDEEYRSIKSRLVERIDDPARRRDNAT